MDKNLLKAIKEQEKQDFKRKFEELSKKPKGIFLIIVGSILINLLVEFIVCKIFRKEFDSVGLFDTALDDMPKEEMSFWEEVLPVFFLSILILSIYFLKIRFFGI